MLCSSVWAILQLFYEDTVKAAQDYKEINLTSRNKNADNPIPTAGVHIIQLKPILMSWLRWSYNVGTRYGAYIQSQGNYYN